MFYWPVKITYLSLTSLDRELNSPSQEALWVTWLCAGMCDTHTEKKQVGAIIRLISWTVLGGTEPMDLMISRNPVQVSAQHYGKILKRPWIWNKSLSTSESFSIKWGHQISSLLSTSISTHFEHQFLPPTMTTALSHYRLRKMSLAKTITFINCKSLFTVSKGNLETIMNDSTSPLGLLINTWKDLYRPIGRWEQTCWL